MEAAIKNAMKFKIKGLTIISNFDFYKMFVSLQTPELLEAVNLM